MPSLPFPSPLAWPLAMWDWGSSLLFLSFLFSFFLKLSPFSAIECHFPFSFTLHLSSLSYSSLYRFPLLIFGPASPWDRPMAHAHSPCVLLLIFTLLLWCWKRMPLVLCNLSVAAKLLSARIIWPFVWYLAIVKEWGGKWQVFSGQEQTRSHFIKYWLLALLQIYHALDLQTIAPLSTPKRGFIYFSKAESIQEDHMPR